ncbi:MAG: hypothetical protein WAL41_25625, partial [Mycobacterium sp.]
LVRSWLTGPGGKVLDTMTTQNISTAYRTSASHLTEAQWLSQHHDTFWVAHQPASHFWIVQGVFGIVLVAVATACVTLAVRAVRARRA